jgi:hypothetical protein
MTPVMRSTPGPEAAAPGAGERLREALASVANHAVLRAPAAGQIDVPELGRVMVHAHNVGGAVDVNVTADRADTRAVLRGHVNGMTADLHQADVPVARLTVDRSQGHGPSFGSTPSFRDGGANTPGSRRDEAAPADGDDDPTPAGGATPGRVRIVL